MVNEETAAAIRRVWDEDGELSAVVELRRRHFPRVSDGDTANRCVRTIVDWRQRPDPDQEESKAAPSIEQACQDKLTLPSVWACLIAQSQLRKPRAQSSLEPDHSLDHRILSLLLGLRCPVAAHTDRMPNAAGTLAFQRLPGKWPTKGAFDLLPLLAETAENPLVLNGVTCIDVEFNCSCALVDNVVERHSRTAASRSNP